jgi:rhodanese-related sulfurtransferase
MNNFFKTVLVCFFIIAFMACNNSPSNNTQSSTNKKETIYTCIPCGYNCDTATYNALGTCSSCKMELVNKGSITFKNILIDSLCALTDSNTIFLDVRTEEEFKGTAPDKFGAIKNAINIPVQELEKRRSELDKFKDKNIVVYCSHAHRSAIASYQLTQSGFSNVNNMLGGMSVWKEKMQNNICISKLYLQQ